MGDQRCPQCGTIFNNSDFRKMTESCGHVMCRLCAVMSESGCNQCKLDEHIRNGNPKRKVVESSVSNNATEFVKVEITETSTLFVFSIPSEPELIQINHPYHPVSIGNANTFSFTYSDPEDSSISTTVQSEANRSKKLRDRPVSPSSWSLQQNDGMVTTSVARPQKSRRHKRLKKKDGSSKDLELEPPSLMPYFITVLEEDPPFYQCNICQRKFKTKKQISLHVFCKKGDKPYKCGYEGCGKEFINKFNYDYHLRIHNGRKALVCHCGKSFNHRSMLAAHKRSHRRNLNRRNCKPSADFQLYRNHNHAMSNHGDYGKGQSHFCHYCGKSFRDVYGLKTHLMVHIDDLPFKCLICGTAYKLKHRLVKHVTNTHSQPKTVAENLADDAGLEYLKETMGDPSLDNIPASKIHSIVISTALKNSKLIIPDGIVTDADLIQNRRVTAGGGRGDASTQTTAGPSNASTQTNFLPCSNPRAPNQPTEILRGVNVNYKEIQIVTLD